MLPPAWRPRITTTTISEQSDSTVIAVLPGTCETMADVRSVGVGIDRVLKPLEPDLPAPAPVTIILGALKHAWRTSQIVEMIDATYGKGYATGRQVKRWLSHGEKGEYSHRVLHLAFRDGKLVGCVLATCSLFIAPKACGHWGMLAIHRAAQGTNVEKELVHAAETHLMKGGCVMVDSEYKYDASVQSQQLRSWYEDGLGFENKHNRVLNRFLGMLLTRGGEFRRCRKVFPKKAM
jgi:GNAT superfamily N-acetyltransferase